VEQLHARTVVAKWHVRVRGHGSVGVAQLIRVLCLFFERRILRNRITQSSLLSPPLENLVGGVIGSEVFDAPKVALPHVFARRKQVADNLLRVLTKAAHNDTSVLLDALYNALCICLLKRDRIRHLSLQGLKNRLEIGDKEMLNYKPGSRLGPC